MSLFVYLPIVMEDKFEKYVYQVIQHTVESISHPKEGIRNLAIKSIKILIRRFLKKNIDLLIAPFYEGAVSSNSTKQNSSLILLGDIIDILNEEFDEKEKLYEAYPRLIGIFYIMKNDTCGEVRITATNIFKTFVAMPTKCLNIICNNLVDSFIELLLRENEHHDQIAINAIKEFSYKYGDSYRSKVINYCTFKKNQADVKVKRGICLFIVHFVKFYNPQLLTTSTKTEFYELLYSLYNESAENVWGAAAQGLRSLSESSNDPKIVDEVLKNYYMNYESYDQTHPKFEKLVAFLCEFLKGRKQSIALSIVAILMDDKLKEWSLEVFLRNSKLLGGLMYAERGLPQGVNYFLEDLEVSSIGKSEANARGDHFRHF